MVQQLSGALQGVHRVNLRGEVVVLGDREKVRRNVEGRVQSTMTTCDETWRTK